MIDDTGGQLQSPSVPDPQGGQPTPASPPPTPPPSGDQPTAPQPPSTPPPSGPPPTQPPSGGPPEGGGLPRWVIVVLVVALVGGAVGGGLVLTSDDGSEDSTEDDDVAAETTSPAGPTTSSGPTDADTAPEEDQTPSGERLWNTRIDGKASIDASGDDQLFVRTGLDGTGVIGLDPRTGDQQWRATHRTSLAEIRTYGPIDGTLIVGDNPVEGLDPETGQQLWEQAFERSAHDDGSLYVWGPDATERPEGCSAQCVARLNIRTGDILWTHDNGEGFEGVAAGGGTLLLWHPRGEFQEFDDLRALDGESGDVRWDWSPPGELVMRGSAPMVVDDRVLVPLISFVGAEKASVALVALDAATGEELWNARRGAGGLVEDPSRPEGLILLRRDLERTLDEPERLSELAAHDLGDGSLLWEAPEFNLAAVSESFLAGHDDKGTVSVLDPATGESLWSRRLGVAAGLHPLAIGDDTLYVGGSEGGRPLVFALDVETGQTRWEAEAGEGDRIARLFLHDDVVVAELETLAPGAEVYSDGSTASGDIEATAFVGFPR